MPNKPKYYLRARDAAITGLIEAGVREHALPRSVWAEHATGYGWCLVDKVKVSHGTKRGNRDG